jgi:hypothetical protein
MIQIEVHLQSSPPIHSELVYELKPMHVAALPMILPALASIALAELLASFVELKQHVLLTLSYSNLNENC